MLGAEEETTNLPLTESGSAEEFALRCIKNNLCNNVINLQTYLIYYLN